MRFFMSYEDLSAKQIDIADCMCDEFIAPRGCGKTTAVLSGALSNCLEDKNKVCVIKRNLLDFKPLLDELCKVKEFWTHTVFHNFIVVDFENGSQMVLCRFDNTIPIKFGNAWKMVNFSELSLFYDYIYFDDIEPCELKISNKLLIHKDEIFKYLSYFVLKSFTFVYSNVHKDNKRLVEIIDNSFCDPFYPSWFKNNNVKHLSYKYAYGITPVNGTLGSIVYDGSSDIVAVQDGMGEVYLVYRQGLKYIRDNVD